MSSSDESKNEKTVQRNYLPSGIPSNKFLIATDSSQPNGIFILRTSWLLNQKNPVKCYWPPTSNDKVLEQYLLEEEQPINSKWDIIELHTIFAEADTLRSAKNKRNFFENEWSSTETDHDETRKTIKKHTISKNSKKVASTFPKMPNILKYKNIKKSLMNDHSPLKNQSSSPPKNDYSLSPLKNRHSPLLLKNNYSSSLPSRNDHASSSLSKKHHSSSPLKNHRSPLSPLKNSHSLSSSSRNHHSQSPSRDDHSSSPLKNHRSPLSSLKNGYSPSSSLRNHHSPSPSRNDHSSSPLKNHRSPLSSLKNNHSPSSSSKNNHSPSSSSKNHQSPSPSRNHYSSLPLLDDNHSSSSLSNLHSSLPLKSHLDSTDLSLLSKNHNLSTSNSPLRNNFTQKPHQARNCARNLFSPKKYQTTDDLLLQLIRIAERQEKLHYKINDNLKRLIKHMKITQASANMDEINDFDCFPLPLHTYNDVKSADHCLNNLEIFKAFKIYLISALNNLGKMEKLPRYRHMLNLLFSKTICDEFTWLGTKTKIPLANTKVVKCLKDSLKETNSYFEADFKEAAKKFFKTKNDQKRITAALKN